MRRILLLLLVWSVLESCSSGKTALKQGNYYEAVLESVNRLRGSPDHKKAKVVLQQGYPLAVQFIEASIQNGINSDDPQKWRNAVRGYEQINNLNTQIKTSLGAMKIISKPETRFNELAEAKKKAAEESYTDGINAMMKNTREDSKAAYFNFKAANDFEPGYRESIEMMNQAEFNATLRVAYEGVNASRINYNGLEPIVNSLQRQFLSFKPITQKDTVPPHQYLKLVFNGYRQGSSNVSNSSENIERDVKVGEKKGADGKTQDVMEKVKAKITYFHKTKGGTSEATITITDASNNAVLQNRNVQGNFMWEYDWATFTGDQRALSTNQLNLCKRREISPDEQDIFNRAIQNLEANVKGNLQSFYSKY